MIKKYWKCIVGWIGIMCCIASLIFFQFLPQIVSATIAFIGLGILVASVMYLLNKM